ncbi:cytochrome P450 [Lentinula detonsa]|uniref:Cytochrome P450 n=1 Tax=Lentinula detonsa TaxID=2804962 RepID=A0A9W8NTI0_9AGAR|nr:cytochrome P450 [Lentinula detonsa]
MQPILKIFVPVLASIVAYYLFRTIRWGLSRIPSPLSLPGPPNPGWFFGHQKEIWSKSTPLGEPTLMDEWHEMYGPTFKAGGFFGGYRIYSMDIKVVQHIMRNDDIYSKPPVMRNLLNMILGEGTGVIVAEGAQHRLQRKAMNPAFGPPQIREFTKTFFDKSLEMRDIWKAQIATEGVGEIDPVEWLSKVTVDIIGLTGFNYHLDALNDGQTNALNEAFKTMFHSNGWDSPWMPLIAALPKSIQSIIKTLALACGVDTTMKSSVDCIQRSCRQLLMENKAQLAATGEKDIGSGSRNLLSLLLKSNMSSDTPAHARMSDADVMAQIPTFLIAGHDTTSLATNWALLELSLHQDIQAKLQEELLSVPTATPSMDELNGLPLLDGFVRETLRLHSPITTLGRIATQDDIIPLAHPFTDRDGTVHDKLPVRKGQLIHITLHQVNTDKLLWGPHADEFRPDRWLNLPDSARTIPGAYSNTLSFWGGSHGCMGWRFTSIEMKVLIFVLLRSFHFELAVQKDELMVLKMASIWQRPSLKSEPLQTRLPLVVKLLKNE